VSGSRLPEHANVDEPFATYDNVLRDIADHFTASTGAPGSMTGVARLAENVDD